MQYQSLLLLALSASALASPFSVTKRRDSKPSIAAYSDSKCLKQVSPSQDLDGCVSIGFTSKYVGVNWGDWPKGINAFDAYTDHGCKKYATKTLIEPAGGPNAEGANTCYELGANGGPWGSVAANYEKSD